MKSVLLLISVIVILLLCLTTKSPNPSSLTPSATLNYKAPLLNLTGKPAGGLTAADTNQLKQSGWYAEALKSMEQKEYEFSRPGDSGMYTTPNRKNNLRFYYDENGFTVQPRTTQIPIGKITAATKPGDIKYKTLPNWKVAFNLNKEQIGEGEWQVAANKAEYKTKNVTVQYINNEEGMRQNFIVQTPLSTGDLKLHFDLETALQIQLQPNRLQFANKEAVVLNYDQLKVWDANGQPLEAVFEKDNHDYCIHVRSNNAVYPITIDPISATPSTTVESNQEDALLGGSVSCAGDVNGDAYSDVIVGAYNYDNGESNEGVAFIYNGSAAGINTTAAAVLECNQAGAGFGLSVAGAGDINGDGYSDVIVGAGTYSNGQLFEGAIYIYNGSFAGINTTAALMVEGNQDLALLGYSVAGAGDVNGDGYNDVIVGEAGYSNGQNNEGVFFIYHGSASGINATAAATVESNQNDAVLGTSVAAAGDVNGDGYSDVIVGAIGYSNGQSFEGAAFLYYGAASGINTTPAALVESNRNDAQLGSSVASAGDVNGDGYSDVVAGAVSYSNGESFEGAVFLYYGSATGINNTAAATFEGNQANARLGSTAGAGDVNGDGYSDIIVAAASYDNGQSDEGIVFIYQGSASGINTTATATLEGNQTTSYLGASVACAGDVNGDGFGDIIVGATGYSNGQNFEGAAFIYHGGVRGISAAQATLVQSNQANSEFGNSVAGAGDVNGDGYADVIVGAYLYDNGENEEGAAFIYHGSASGLSNTPAVIIESNQAGGWMGYSVAGAGDINGDGYSDVIVGVASYNTTVNNEGAAFVYYGSASGVNTNPTIIQGTQVNALLGYSVAGAGDVNGDGYSDVIVGAPYYDNGQPDEGVVYIYHGAASGISTTAATMLQSNQADAYFGISVAGAGDVNGDGFSDVIVGAHFYDDGHSDEGAAFIYHGAALGIGTTAAATVEVDQNNAFLGNSVAGAGDVNGDGYADVLVGAYLYDLGNGDLGAALLYYGSASGINAASAVTLRGNPGSTGCGWSVASAGDVNSDGYSDVIVNEYGWTVLVFHGSASGINTTAMSAIVTSQPNDMLGWWVAGAGDVNGDGFSDVLAGAPIYEDGENDEGATFLYYGGNSKGRQNSLNLYNTDLVTPINSSNFPGSTFGAGLFAKSITSVATKGKLMWETEISYQAYSGSPITNSMVYTGIQSSYTSLGSTPVQFTTQMTKQTARYTKVRARVKYEWDAATATTGQVYGPWRYASDMAYLTLMSLPVNLISFKAAWLSKGKSAQLTFVTDNESDVCCYHIQKSSDGVNFTTIGTVASKNATVQTTYGFTDNNAVGPKLYYRLQTVFTNGFAEYSNIQWLQNNSVTEIIAFPNPATNALQLRLNNSYATMNVQIINSAGQTVSQYSNLSTTGQKVTIPVSQLAAGTYFLYLQSGGEKQVLQFVKQ